MLGDGITLVTVEKLLKDVVMLLCLLNNERKIHGWGMMKWRVKDSYK